MTSHELVDKNVFANASSLVATLAAGVYLDVSFLTRDHGSEQQLRHLFGSAAELAAIESGDTEFWIVSTNLADKLEAHGEKVDRDFAGLVVWARTTTGQAIYADSVIEAIAREVSL